MLFTGFQLLLGERLNKPEQHASGRIYQRIVQKFAHRQRPECTKDFLHIVPKGILMDERWVGRAGS